MKTPTPAFIAQARADRLPPIGSREVRRAKMFAHRAFTTCEDEVSRALSEPAGLTLITGSAGTGKSTVAMRALESVRRSGAPTAWVVTTQLAPRQLLGVAAHELGLSQSGRHQVPASCRALADAIGAFADDCAQSGARASIR